MPAKQHIVYMRDRQPKISRYSTCGLRERLAQSAATRICLFLLVHRLHVCGHSIGGLRAFTAELSNATLEIGSIAEAVNTQIAIRTSAHLRRAASKHADQCSWAAGARPGKRPQEVPAVRCRSVQGQHQLDECVRAARRCRHAQLPPADRLPPACRSPHAPACRTAGFGPARLVTARVGILECTPGTAAGAALRRRQRRCRARSVQHPT